jgi:hypothetical protein
MGHADTRVTGWALPMWEGAVGWLGLRRFAPSFSCCRVGSCSFVCAYWQFAAGLGATTECAQSVSTLCVGRSCCALQPAQLLMHSRELYSPLFMTVPALSRVVGSAVCHSTLGRVVYVF